MNAAMLCLHVFSMVYRPYKQVRVSQYELTRASQQSHIRQAFASQNRFTFNDIWYLRTNRSFGIHRSGSMGALGEQTLY